MPALALAIAVTAEARAASPIGEVTVDCDGVRGWARDPDTPATKIAVHLYFDGPAGDPPAVGLATVADRDLGPGCRGDHCAHGFAVDLPLSRRDGASHPVYAYGIDSGDDPNAMLAGSPQSYACPPLPLTVGIKRHILSPAILDAWRLSLFFDLMAVDDLALAGLPVGPAIDSGPEFAIEAGSEGPIWLLDQGFRRPLSEHDLAAWRLVAADAATLDPELVASFPVGTPLMPRPMMVRGTGPKVYLVDLRQCEADDPDPACADPEGTTGESSASDGTDGTDGTGGSSGTDGSDGSSGTDGTDGTNGSDGTTGGSSAGETAGATSEGSGSAATEASGGEESAGEVDGGGCACRSDPEVPGGRLMSLASLASLALLAVARRRRRRFS